jgi:hypothetical protein
VACDSLSCAMGMGSSTQVGISLRSARLRRATQPRDEAEVVAARNSTARAIFTGARADPSARRLQ